ncbi:WD repeat-containing and planar cell polarity effector protein fritz homolog [Caerostris darwini]|uniref:WD repeat-containing and planar cell polarity effector protein fritz homolog n=1 Tax=Caerostris darwini TaxID=1538125 RepID=A0AAV4PZF1_9ARAC|nr:WD repeat-containing and planar cell polarity effector protein fritz homolog [Caerostris darwini]
MTSFLTSLYLLSFRQAEEIHGNDLDCIKITSKNLCTQGLYSDAKTEFFRSRCSGTKQHWGWKKNLKSVDKLFKSYKCVFLSWELNQPLLMLFSNGSIVCIEFNGEGNTLKNIEIDNHLCGKFIPSRIIDAIICQNFIFVTYSEPKLSIIHINKENASFSSKILGKKKGKLIGSEPKITHIDLIGSSSKNLERKLSLNSYKDHLLIWWKFTGTDVWPWTPVSYAVDRINMLVYTLNDCVEILCTIKVHGELINAKYSSCHSNQILALVEVKRDNSVSINVSVYEIIQEQCHHAFVMQLPLQGKVISFDWSSTDKLLISDSNNLLLIYDLKKKTSIVTNLLFIPKFIIWHPQDCIALVTSSTGQVQCFDAALTCAKFKLLYKSFTDCDMLELNSQFAQSCSVQNVLWQKSIFNDKCLILLDSDMSSFILLKFTLGSITKNNFSASEIISQYLKSNLIDEAILLLKSLNWCQDSELYFQCLSKIANFLLRKPLNLKCQAGLELVLGTFYTSVDDLPKRILKLYQHKINHIARRFFHHLLRYHQFRKAFLLAVDLESQDLFLDLFHVAQQKGENALACVALHKANKFYSLQNSASNSSAVSGSSIDDTASEDGDWEDPVIQHYGNTGFETGSDTRYWLPESDKSNVNVSWLNSSETEMHIQQPFEKQYLHNGQFLKSNIYEQMSSYNRLSVDAEKSNCDKLHFVPTLNHRPLPSVPSSYCPKSSEPYVSNNNSTTSLSTSIRSKDISLHNSKHLLGNKLNESTLQMAASSSLHNLSYNAESSYSNLSHRDKACFMSNPNPRPLPTLPPHYSMASQPYVSAKNSIKSEYKDFMPSNNEELLFAQSAQLTVVNKTEEENEEIEDSRIKLKHFGII